MLYRQFKDKKVSQLGMGNMRLPTEGERGPIDEVKARELIEYAYGQGINYFDTAYRYHGGKSETFVSSVLRQYPRDSWYLATKMPGHMMQYKNGRIEGIGYLANETITSLDQIFEDQLKRCGVDYFDFYLLHNVCETAYDFYTNEELGVVDYLLAQKKAGRIRHFGFSAHGRPETIEKFLAWSDSRFPGGCLEIAQIQLNYLDWTLQDARGKYEILTKRGIPVVAMEPCRGGKLASFDEKVNALFKAARPDDSIASWAFRYLKSLPNVQVTLSGMSSLEQLKDNLRNFSEPSSLTDEENAILQKVVASLVDLIPCTACRYCSEECPQKLDIPKLISIYNEAKNGDASVWGLLNFTLGAMTEAELPSSCSVCGNCRQVCPQGIDVPDLMRKLAEAIDKNSKRK